MASCVLTLAATSGSILWGKLEVSVLAYGYSFGVEVSLLYVAQDGSGFVEGDHHAQVMDDLFIPRPRDFAVKELHPVDQDADNLLDDHTFMGRMEGRTGHELKDR